MMFFCVKKKYLTPLSNYGNLPKVIEMEKIGRQVFLYDFYGELLTEHQKSVYEDVVLNDLSLSEIAEERGISRQGVHDLIKRCDRILNSYEEKLHLVERFIRTRDDVTRIWELSGGRSAGEVTGGSFQNDEKMDSDLSSVSIVGADTLNSGEADSRTRAGLGLEEECSGVRGFRNLTDVMQEIHRISGRILEEL